MCENERSPMVLAESIGSKPLTKKVSVTAVTEEIISGMIAVILISSSKISITNITPVMGALKIADRAAATPHASISVILR